MDEKEEASLTTPHDGIDVVVKNVVVPAAGAVPRYSEGIIVEEWDVIPASLKRDLENFLTPLAWVLTIGLIVGWMRRNAKMAARTKAAQEKEAHEA